VARAAFFPSSLHCATLSITGFKECLPFQAFQLLADRLTSRLF
jgi:hypothetical protein